MLDKTPFAIGLSQKRIDLLDKFIASPDESFLFLQNILMNNAQAKGNPINPVHLRLAQLRPVAMSYVNPRFFIGDKPGLGKTVMSAGCVALYQTQERKKGNPVKKVLVVTDSSHVKGFAREWESFGIPLMQLAGGKAAVQRALKNGSLEDYEGVIVNWDTLKTNTFIEFFAKYHHEFGISVFDETSRLLNPKSTIYKVTNLIINKYQGGIERAIFLNGSSFEKNIFDFYYQFDVLQPSIIPTKGFLEENFIIREGRVGTYHDYDNKSYMHSKHMLLNTGAIVDYRNQDVLREKLRYYYIARSKRDYAKDIPTHSYLLHLIEMTPAQKKISKFSKVVSKLNSPATNSPNAEVSRKTLPKLDFLIDRAVKTADDRPIIYAYNIEIQHTIAQELRNLGYCVEIVNGEQSTTQRDEIITRFNNFQIDMLVFNIRKAINIPTSDRILIYDIPTMPQQTSQLMGRIDRDNYENGKIYDFLCYSDSIEMVNMVRLAYFREAQSSAFTGQLEEVYKTLQNQLEHFIDEGKLTEARSILDQIDEGLIELLDVQNTLDKLLEVKFA